MSVLYSIASFVLAIGVLVTVHEFGHFWVARRLGVKVLRFSVGFGKPLWVRRAGVDQTEYVVAAIPLGGYVKMLDEAEGEVAASELHRAFNRQSLRVRFAIVFAGPAFNFLFAVFAYWLMFMLGVSGLRPLIGEVSPGSIAAEAGLRAGQTVVAVAERPTLSWERVIQTFIEVALDEDAVSLSVRDAQGLDQLATLNLQDTGLDDLTNGKFFDSLGLTPQRPVIEPVIGGVQIGLPAHAAGLQAGDRVLSGDGEAIESWRAWVTYVRARPNQTIALVVERAGAQFTFSLTPKPVASEQGEFGRIGASVAAPQASRDRYYITERYSPIEAFTRSLGKTWDVSALTLSMIWKMVTLEVSAANLSGPISIAQYAGFSAQNGIARFLEFLAIVSISLGILNLLPIPLLDGGHLMYYFIELFRGEPVSEQIQFVGQRLGITFLVGLMGLAFYNDLTRLFG